MYQEGLKIEVHGSVTMSANREVIYAASIGTTTDDLE